MGTHAAIASSEQTMIVRFIDSSPVEYQSV